MHARYDPMKGFSENCRKGEDEQGLCFGGFARVKTAVEQIRTERTTLFLNAGDTFQGTPWYTLFKGDLAADLMNMLNPDAMSLGNHEFDDKVEGLLPFLNKVQFPVVCANLDLAKVPKMKAIKSLVNSIIITKFEMKIGIIGYLTPETKTLVALNDVEFYQEIPMINGEAKKLTKRGVKIIIALGHSGYQMDQEIALRCKDVDLVVGGHSHTFLFTGSPPHKEKSAGNYPTVVIRSNGQQVPVVQAYAFTKYLGVLDMEFDNGGRLLTFDGAPILLDRTVKHDSQVKAFLDSKRQAIEELEGQVVGVSKAYLDGDGSHCRTGECNLGNLITDAIVYARVTENLGGIYWTDASIALYNGGGIRATVDSGVEGTITSADIITVLPYKNEMMATRIMGKDLIKSLEYSASLRKTSASGGFLQVSGIRFIINYNYPKGKRISSVYVRCSECKIPKYENLHQDDYYWVIVSSYLLGGGDGYRYLKDARHPQIRPLTLTDTDILTKYLQEHKIVYPAVENRITIVGKTHLRSSAIQIQASLIPYVMYSLYILAQSRFL
ncbi:GH21407 [Drosophila grimshawi]|uniref:5'-nucleotidase n=2 Tax=Drosophila grimshawi TaxID=7222 RepID=B4J934_DROGR|nr:GH21407 [Drosophila grimshawi]